MEPTTHGRIRITAEIAIADPVVFRQTIDGILNMIAHLGLPPDSLRIDVQSVNAPPPVTDPTDHRILKWVTEDPDLKDQAIAQRLGMRRQAVNARRRGLEKMGYRVR